VSSSEFPPPVWPWQRRRMAFNHDWLKNSFCVELNKAVNVYSGQVEDPVFADSFVSSARSVWFARRREVTALLISFSEEMSPRALFSYLPLNRLPPGTRRELADTMHNLWLLRYSVDRMLDSVRLAADALDREIAALDGQDSQQPQDRARSIGRVRSRAQELAFAIEQLPSRILVV